MTAVRLTFCLLLATVAIAATACGGGSDAVPAGAVANVDGTEITKAQLAELMAISKSGYERGNQTFPKAGTPEYQSIQTRNVAYVVQLTLFQKAAENLGVAVTEKDIDKIENETIESKFAGKRADYEKALKKAGFTREQYRRLAYEYSVLNTKIFEKVTKDVEVTDQDVLEYYTANQAQYGGDSRDVRHILISEKKKNGDVDFEASKAKADEIFAQLKGGASFAALAKQFSDDPGSKNAGGKLTIERGKTVPEFDKTAFELKTGELSKPVKTTYGYHVIEAVSDVRKGATLDSVKASIRTTLLQSKRNDEMQTWLDGLKADYDSKVSYAAGYEPPELPEAPTQTQ